MIEVDKAGIIKTPSNINAFLGDVEKCFPKWTHRHSFTHKDIAAFEIAQIPNGFSFWKDAANFVVDLRKIFVLEDFRGRGFGKEIISTLQSFGTERCVGLCLYANLLGWFQPLPADQVIFRSTSEIRFPALIESLTDLSRLWNEEPRPFQNGSRDGLREWYRCLGFHEFFCGLQKDFVLYPCPGYPPVSRFFLWLPAGIPIPKAVSDRTR